MVYSRIIKVIKFTLLGLSIYFATQKNTIYIILVSLSALIEYAQPNRPKIPYKSRRKAIYLPNQMYGTMERK